MNISAERKDSKAMSQMSPSKPIKICFKCGAEKPLTEFYAHPAMLDGHLGKCKECAKRDVTLRRLENIIYAREYDRKRSMLPHRIAARRAYDATLPGKRARRKARQNQRRIHPERIKARYELGAAVRAGRIKPQPCIKCGSTRTHAHHPDYNKPLTVVWLCVTHHREVHKNGKK